MFTFKIISLRALNAVCLKKVNFNYLGPRHPLSVQRYKKFLSRSVSTSASRFELLNETHGDGKTTVTVMNQDMPEVLMINSYSEMGFRLNYDFFVVGPAVLFPKLVLQWNVGNSSDTITEESLSLFKTLDPPPDVVIIGIGNAGTRPNPKLIKFCIQNKINAEFLPTYQACTTFNFLNAEQRYVVAALIPPTIVTYKHSLIGIQRKKMLELGDEAELNKQNDSTIKPV